jgi:hypothetical protein
LNPAKLSQNNLCIKIPLVSLLTTKFFVLEHTEAKILHVSSESRNPVDVLNIQLVITRIYLLKIPDNKGYRGKNMSYTWNSIYLRACKMKKKQMAIGKIKDKVEIPTDRRYTNTE